MALLAIGSHLRRTNYLLPSSVFPLPTPTLPKRCDPFQQAPVLLLCVSCNAPAYLLQGHPSLTWKPHYLAGDVADGGAQGGRAKHREMATCHSHTPRGGTFVCEHPHGRWEPRDTGTDSSCRARERRCILFHRTGRERRRIRPVRANNIAIVTPGALSHGRSWPQCDPCVSSFAGGHENKGVCYPRTGADS